MRETLRGVDGGRLERPRDRREFIRLGSRAEGVERSEAFFTAAAFAPHRHDTYAIGLTTAGVQTFRYRGERRVCRPGQLHVLHPDETHDGAPGTDAGFGYRILYLAPELICRALDRSRLPFVADPVQNRTASTHRLVELLREPDEPIDELRRVEIVAIVADTLQALGDGPQPGPGRVDLRAVELVREHLLERAREQTPAAALETLAGMDRFTITRHFRRVCGTSPDRYRTLRRLAIARAAIAGGMPLAEASADAGFADQSHLTRQFRRAYGMTPARWAEAVRVGAASRAPTDELT